MGGFRSSPTELTQCWDIKLMSGEYHSTYNVANLAIELREALKKKTKKVKKF